MGHLVCAFCYLKLEDKILKQEDPCCENKELMNDNGMNVCQNCWIVDSYDFITDYLDFNENRQNQKKVCLSP